MNGTRVRVSRRLLDVGLEWIREPLRPDRGGRAGVFALEVARLMGSEVRRRAQARLEALPPAAQAARLGRGGGRRRAPAG